MCTKWHVWFNIHVLSIPPTSLPPSLLPSLPPSLPSSLPPILPPSLPTKQCWRRGCWRTRVSYSFVVYYRFLGAGNGVFSDFAKITFTLTWTEIILLFMKSYYHYEREQKTFRCVYVNVIFAKSLLLQNVPTVFALISSKLNTFQLWNLSWVMRKMWTFLWYQNLHKFEQVEKRSRLLKGCLNLVGIGIKAAETLKRLTILTDWFTQ